MYSHTADKTQNDNRSKMAPLHKNCCLNLLLFLTDIDECATRQNNCTKDQMCINTYGGFQCVRVDCPKIPNATYVKTSPMWVLSSTTFLDPSSLLIVQIRHLDSLIVWISRFACQLHLPLSFFFVPGAVNVTPVQWTTSYVLRPQTPSPTIS